MSILLDVIGHTLFFLGGAGVQQLLMRRSTTKPQPKPKYLDDDTLELLDRVESMFATHPDLFELDADGFVYSPQLKVAVGVVGGKVGLYLDWAIQLSKKHPWWSMSTPTLAVNVDAGTSTAWAHERDGRPAELASRLRRLHMRATSAVVLRREGAALDKAIEAPADLGLRQQKTVGKA